MHAKGVSVLSPEAGTTYIQGSYQEIDKLSFEGSAGWAVGLPSTQSAVVDRI